MLFFLIHRKIEISSLAKIPLSLDDPSFEINAYKSHI